MILTFKYDKMISFIPAGGAVLAAETGYRQAVAAGACYAMPDGDPWPAAEAGDTLAWTEDCWD